MGTSVGRQLPGAGHRESFWSREALDFLAKRYGKEGWPVSRIRKELPGPPKTDRAIRSKAAYLGITKGRKAGRQAHRQHMIDDIIDMMLLDSTQREIAEELSRQYETRVHPDWVSRVMRKEINPSSYFAWRQRQMDRNSRCMKRTLFLKKVAQ
ncbi:hypothetical protein [Halomonas sp. BN3-1]|uniref:hypothetical protein n=1 Tax=Halomonas sp. BN3-1 TaxID=2082393 RepID=UPI0013B3EDB3|nr:hypothetical protein [Halomonas sp. BN3-1]